MHGDQSAVKRSNHSIRHHTAGDAKVDYLCGLQRPMMIHAHETEYNDNHCSKIRQHQPYDLQMYKSVSYARVRRQALHALQEVFMCLRDEQSAVCYLALRMAGNRDYSGSTSLLSIATHNPSTTLENRSGIQVRLRSMLGSNGECCKAGQLGAVPFMTMPATGICRK